MPFRFYHEVERAFPELWAAEIEFPLSRLAHYSAKSTFEASAAEWERVYPHIPYQVVVSDPAGKYMFIAGDGVLDIRGFTCLSEPCSMARREPQTIPAAKWSDARLGKCPFVCPACGTSPTGSEPFTGSTFHAFSQIAFGVEIWELWECPIRQLGAHGFIETILNLVDTSEANMTHAQHRYIKFLQVMRNATGISVPTVDIDLFWHTHQLTPLAYETYCLTYLGRKIYHDDSIACSPRHDALHFTKIAWIAAYNEQFLDPDSPAQLSAIATRQATHDRLLDEFKAHQESATAEITRTKALLDASQQPLADARNLLARAIREEDLLRMQLAQIDTAKRKAPRLRLFKFKYLTDASKQAISSLDTERAAIEAKIAAGSDHLGQLQRTKFVKDEERAARYRTWSEATMAKRTIDTEWRAKVEEARFAISQTVVDYPPRDDKDGPIYSVVGTEADPVRHIVGAPVVSVRDRKDGKMKVRSWFESYARAQKIAPDVLRPAGARLLRPFGVEGPGGGLAARRKWAAADGRRNAGRGGGDAGGGMRGLWRWWRLWWRLGQAPWSSVKLEVKHLLCCEYSQPSL